MDGGVLDMVVVRIMVVGEVGLGDEGVGFMTTRSGKWMTLIYLVETLCSGNLVKAKFKLQSSKLTL